MTNEASESRQQRSRGDGDQGRRWETGDAAVIREMIKHEDELANHRISWMVTLQGLLFAALGFAWKDGRELIYVLGALGVATSLSSSTVLLIGRLSVATLLCQ